jgi:FkbM family methyltransferase
MRVKGGTATHIPGGFTNPDALIFCGPDGLEWIILREMGEYLEDLHLNNLSTVIDIGAHVGVVSMTYARRYGCRVYAYEPNPDNYRRLVANIQANGLDNLITAYHRAVTGNGRFVTISSDERNSGGAMIYTNGGMRVPSVTLADCISAAGGSVDLLKIDCEGAEYEIFDGADLRTIRAIRGEFHGKEKARELFERVRQQVNDIKVVYS